LQLFPDTPVALGPLIEEAFRRVKPYKAKLMYGAFKLVHLVVLIVVIICFVVYYKYDTNKTDRIWEELKEEYPALSFESQLKGVVTRIVQADVNIFRNAGSRSCCY
jgi:hypothetical protein